MTNSWINNRVLSSSIVETEIVQQTDGDKTQGVKINCKDSHQQPQAMDVQNSDRESHDDNKTSNSTTNSNNTNNNEEERGNKENDNSTLDNNENNNSNETYPELDRQKNILVQLLRLAIWIMLIGAGNKLVVHWSSSHGILGLGRLRGLGGGGAGGGGGGGSGATGIGGATGATAKGIFTVLNSKGLMAFSASQMYSTAASILRWCSKWQVTLCVGASTWIVAARVAKKWYRAKVYAERAHRTQLEHEADRRKLGRSSSDWKSWREQAKREREEICRRVEQGLAQ